MSLAEKVTEYRERGNEKYRNQDYEGAYAEYSSGLAVYPESIPLLVNRALAEIKLHQFTGAIRDCTDALVLDRTNVKALVRRAMAWRGKNKPHFALDDLNSAHKYSPSNMEIQKMLKSVEQELIQQQEEQEILKEVMSAGSTESFFLLITSVVNIITTTIIFIIVIFFL
jgi:tetratricopeptide (TPR) repeat protein